MPVDDTGFVIDCHNSGYWFTVVGKELFNKCLVRPVVIICLIAGSEFRFHMKLMLNLSFLNFYKPQSWLGYLPAIYSFSSKLWWLTVVGQEFPCQGVSSRPGLAAAATYMAGSGSLDEPIRTQVDHIRQSARSYQKREHYIRHKTPAADRTTTGN